VGFRKQMKTQGAVRSAAPTHPASKSSLPIVRSAHLRLLHKIVSAKVLPERSKGGYGVVFEFSDGWVEACFHMTKEAERQTRRIGVCVPKT
jgi:hypothetical protein